jgi:hypothetical protein
MVDSLNHFYVTCTIFKDGAQVHEVSCPVSLIQKLFNNWVFPGSPYTIKVVDHTNNFRISSDIFDRTIR